LLFIDEDLNIIKADAGVLRDYKIEVAINNQHHPKTIDQLETW
jgi:hypothetical protein